MYTVEGGRKLGELVRRALEKNLTLLITGPPGIGKSEIIFQRAREVNLRVQEVRLYLMDPGEAKGIPDIIDGETFWSRPAWLPKEPRVVLLFDDIHLCDELRQAPLFELLLTRRLHGHTIPDEVRIIAAGNIGVSASGGSEILAPVMNRFDLAVEFVPTVDDFSRYAAQHNVERKIIYFLNTYQNFLYTKNPPSSMPFPSPRSWFSLDKNLKAGFGPTVAPGVVGVEAGSRLVDAWPVLDLDEKALLGKKASELKDQVMIASALTKYEPKKAHFKKLSEFHKEAQLIYFKLQLIYHPEPLVRMDKDPDVSAIVDQLLEALNA